MRYSHSDPADNNGRRTPIRVLIIDDRDIVAQALSAMLEAEAGIKVVGRSGSVAGAISQTHQTAPDVVILDYWLPDGTAEEACSAIRRQADPPAILILSAEKSEHARRRCFEAGASAFLSKAADAAEIPRNIRRAAGSRMPAVGRLATLR